MDIKETISEFLKLRPSDKQIRSAQRVYVVAIYGDMLGSKCSDTRDGGFLVYLRRCEGHKIAI